MHESEALPALPVPFDEGAPPSLSATARSVPADSLLAVAATPPLALLGAAVFGFVLHSAAQEPGITATSFAWATGFPAAILLSGIGCLPALFILSASHQRKLSLADYLAAARTAFGIGGVGLACSAPILWFWAITAPASAVLAPLGLVLTALGLLGAYAGFFEALRVRGGSFTRVVRWSFSALLALTFDLVAHAMGLHW